MRGIAFAVAASALIGCMPDSELVQREQTAARLRAEARARKSDLRALAVYRDRLENAVHAGVPLGERTSLFEELRKTGFAVSVTQEGAMLLHLSESQAFVPAKLAQAASVLRRRLPDHELSVESNDIDAAVEAVRILHERVGVPGVALSAGVGTRPGISLEVRPTRMESLKEVLAAAAD